MNRIFISTFFTVLVFAGLTPLEAMKGSGGLSFESQTSSDPVQRFTSLQELVLNAILKVRDEEILRDKTVAEFVEMYCELLKNRYPKTTLDHLRDTFVRKLLNISSHRDLFNSLKILCNNLTDVQFNIIMSEPDAIMSELGACVRKLLAESQKSLLTLRDEWHETILDCAVNDKEVSAQIIRVICCAAGDDVQQLIMKQDQYIKTALHKAASKGNTEFVKALIKAAGDNFQTLLMKQDYLQKTALHRATSKGNTEVAKALLEAADNNAQELLMKQDYLQKTALHKAASKGNAEVAKALLEAAGDKVQELVMKQDNDGKTALNIARQNGCIEIAALLQKYLNP